MLFAEQLDAGAQTLAVGGWVGGALSVVATAVTGYLSYRLSRDRLQFDAEVIGLKGRLRELERDVAEAKRAEERAVASEVKCRLEVADLRTEMKKVTDYMLYHGVPLGPVAPPPQKE